MWNISPQILFFLLAAVFVSVIFAHLVKKNSSAVFLYAIQSAAIAVLLIISSLHKPSYLLFFAVAATIAVKIIIAPYFFFGLIKKHKLQWSASTHLNLPLTLATIAFLSALSHTSVFLPIAKLGIYGQDFLQISFASISISLFLIINRRGVLSQMIGILSLENSIVAFALLSGLEGTPGLQIGITFDIMVWVVMASVFAGMIYRQFGSLDATKMNELTE